MIDIKTFKPDETAKSSLKNKFFDPDKRIDVKGNKTDNTGGEKGFDSDRRIDVNESKMDNTVAEKGFDPDRRIDVNESKMDNTVAEKGFDPDKRVDLPEVEHLKCFNEGLEGTEHPKTGVRFEGKIVDLGHKQVEGVFPVFESAFDTYLPTENLKSCDATQFRRCNEQLKAALDQNPSLREKFTPDQIEQIMNGDTPDGYVWHHNEEPGKMQLVDFETHDKTEHTGGKSIWGGGR